MKRFGKFRDPRFALTTLQNPTWEVRTRAELIQAAQQALERQPDAAELPFALRPAAPLIPPPATVAVTWSASLPVRTTEPTPQSQTEPPPEPEPQTQVRPEPEPQSELQPEPQPELQPIPSAASDVVPVASALPELVAEYPAKPKRAYKPRPKRQPQPPDSSGIMPGPDAAEFVVESLDLHAKKAAGPHHKTPSKLSNPERHSRKCAICHHPDRADIEEDFLSWRNAELIQKDHKLPNYRTIYRHARTHGLYERRRQNLRFAAELLIEHADQARPDANVILRAIRACACINRSGEWVEPARRVIVSSRDQLSASALAPAPQSNPQPEFQELVPEPASSTHSSVPISISTDANSPFLINGPEIRK